MHEPTAWEIAAFIVGFYVEATALLVLVYFLMSNRPFLGVVSCFSTLALGAGIMACGIPETRAQILQWFYSTRGL